MNVLIKISTILYSQSKRNEFLYCRNVKTLRIVLVLTSFVLFINQSLAQISPGELTNAHAQFEGLSNCTKCHVFGEQVTKEKCLDCHLEIKNLINSNSGYHSSRDAKGKNCWTCHNEHHGRNFQIIHFDKKAFDHKKANFELKAKHAKIDCFDCHQAKFIQNPQLKKHKGTFLGLNQSCTSCHEDYHQKALGNDCSSCHDNETFRPAKFFNHNKAKFKLTGKHLDVECQKCHHIELRNETEFQKFKGIAFSSCNSCHKDVHNAKFGSDCEKCHSTASFRIVNQNVFNHDKTDFPLRGKHAKIKCTQCHRGNKTQKLPHQKCNDCHIDYHKGEFTINNLQIDCSQCHTVDGFTPSIFTIEQHNKTKFKLSGSHLAVSCQGCHFKNNRWTFKLSDGRCIDCHKNIHRKEISQKFMGENECEKCHTTESWSSINFNHKLTDFELLGKHNKISCNGCHKILDSLTNQKESKFVSINKECINCHEDVHFNQFKVNGKTDCLRCHIFDNWKPEKFNHDNTIFPLIGAHQNVLCSKCHPTMKEGKKNFVKFKLINFKCSDCHGN